MRSALQFSSWTLSSPLCWSALQLVDCVTLQAIHPSGILESATLSSEILVSIFVVILWFWYHVCFCRWHWWSFDLDSLVKYWIPGPSIAWLLVSAMAVAYGEILVFFDLDQSVILDVWWFVVLSSWFRLIMISKNCDIGLLWAKCARLVLLRSCQRGLMAALGWLIPIDRTIWAYLRQNWLVTRVE